MSTSDLNRVVRYGRARGWRVKTYPRWKSCPWWFNGAYAHADKVPGTTEPRAELAYVWWRFLGKRRTRLTAALCHEYGHCEQGEIPLGWSACQSRWELEVDAWHRGLRIYGELGLPITYDVAAEVLECLATYDDHVSLEQFGYDVRQLLDALTSAQSSTLTIT